MPQFDAPLFNAATFGAGIPSVCNIKCRDLLYIAFREARILQRPQGLNSDNELKDGLIFLNQQVDYWAARACYAYTTTFVVYTLTPGHQPHLIGPGLPPPDFDIALRPTSIQSASVILGQASGNVILTGQQQTNAGQQSSTPDLSGMPGWSLPGSTLPGGPVPQDATIPPGGTTPPGGAGVSSVSASPVDVPLRLRDNAWWANQRVKSIQSTIPTDLYYEADFPNGQLWFWPIPNTGYDVRLEGNVVLQEFQTLDDCFIAPQAYRAAITLTLAEELCDIWGTATPPNLPRRALKAREALQSNNNLAPRIASADYGTFSSPSGDFNYLTGTIPDR